MNKFKLYRQMKTEYAYSLYKNNLSFEKVRAIIIKDKKILLVHKIKSDKYALPGGGVEYGENIEIAVERECYEEAKAKVKLRSVVGILNYNVKMSYKGEDFISTRIEYYCLCDFLNFIKKKKFYGLNGEFFERVEVVWYSIDKIEKTNLSDYCISKIKKLASIQSKSKTNNQNNVQNKSSKKDGKNVKMVATFDIKKSKLVVKPEMSNKCKHKKNKKTNCLDKAKRKELSKSNSIKQIGNMQNKKTNLSKVKNPSN